MRRPGHYVKRTGNMICERIALGDTLEEALQHVGYLAPSETQFWRWYSDNPEFKERYDAARMLQADKLADMHLSLSKEVLSNPKVAPAYKVAADILKWQAEVRNRGKFSDKSAPERKVPMNAEEIRAEISRLSKVLGIEEKPEGEPKLRSVK